ncbi:deoxyguanosinetriphosphate triphosphohydrolase [Nocardioides sp. GY 10127]|uniref:deoxyguanosinetriphosphate triphosphohydrolase n=1 Tax=Nocardioides sp. GY 10127 TaxID=2569762 RepID=UPI0010A84BDA|nr:deoxyguanosinetriphosphate triphosphohydrolase [Nocardioides sp. GY 10127]TIC83952.1 deoxyguanosinetriphosphate triphosphohydrolase [Nocardioides sp. GY 10127]
MDPHDLYSAADAERLVPEPPKRVDAPVRTPFERDRARVVHAASSRRLAAKTQVVGPASDDFVRNRLTHSLEVAQVARDLSRALGSQPDIAETAALAHDLGHPPFGHNGEQLLASVSEPCGGFEGNAQTLRLLTRLEAKTVDAEGRSVGLNLTRATLDACTKYPWERADAEPAGGVHADGTPRGGVKFGVYPDDVPVFAWFRTGSPAGPDGGPGRRRCLEAQVMDLADDVAYSVHDVEDGVVAGKIDLTRLDLAAVGESVRAWYVPDADDDTLAEVLAGLRAVGSWPTRAHDGSRAGLAALKNLTSDLIGRFCGDVQAATFAGAQGPFVRYAADLVVPRTTLLEISLLKGVAAHYVMQTDERLSLMERQRDLLAGLVDVLLARGPEVLDRPFADDWREAADDAGRLRVVVDQVASLTDASAVAWHARLCAGAHPDLPAG